MQEPRHWTSPVIVTLVVTVLCLLSSGYGNYLQWEQVQLAITAQTPSSVAPDAGSTPLPMNYGPLILSSIPSLLSVLALGFIFNRVTPAPWSKTKFKDATDSGHILVPISTLPSRLKIHSAMYGNSNDGYHDRLQPVRDAVKGDSLSILVGPECLGDPIEGKSKDLVVEYSYDGGPIIAATRPSSRRLILPEDPYLLEKIHALKFGETELSRAQSIQIDQLRTEVQTHQKERDLQALNLKPTLVGEIQEAMFQDHLSGNYGSFLETHITLKVHLANTSPCRTTIKRFDLVIENEGRSVPTVQDFGLDRFVMDRKVRGAKDLYTVDVLTSEDLPDLSKLLENCPLDQGVGYVGWLRFVITDLESRHTDRDGKYILTAVDALDNKHLIIRDAASWPKTADIRVRHASERHS